jgi:integrase
VSSIEKLKRNGQPRWYARYRDPGGAQLVTVFDRKLDAERFLTTVEASKLTAGHIDIKRASIKFRDFTVSAHSLRHHFGVSLISRGVSVVAVSRWLGHSSPEITYRVYAYLKPDDEQAGRAALAETLRSIVPDVHPLGTREASE